jgi:hypothetical protein
MPQQPSQHTSKRLDQENQAGQHQYDRKHSDPHCAERGFLPLHCLLLNRNGLMLVLDGVLIVCEMLLLQISDFFKQPDNLLIRHGTRPSP